MSSRPDSAGLIGLTGGVPCCSTLDPRTLDTLAWVQARRNRRSFWRAAILVALLSAALRLINLGRPATQVAEEVYCAPAGQDLLRHGVEWDSERRDAPGALAYRD